jgi:hypothetical protein
MHGGCVPFTISPLSVEDLRGNNLVAVSIDVSRYHNRFPNDSLHGKSTGVYFRPYILDDDSPSAAILRRHLFLLAHSTHVRSAIEQHPKELLVT